MADHYHYASDLHQVAEEHHRHYDLEGKDDGLRQDLDSLRYRVSDLEEALEEARRDLSELRLQLRTFRPVVPAAEEEDY